MKIGIFGGTVNSGTIDDVVNEAKQAESDGFASYWAPNIFGHDALTALAIVGREVPRIEIGTSVVPTYPRHPIAIAQQSHTVNAVSNGRLCLGIGLSHKVVVEGMLGMSYEKPVRHLREYLRYSCRWRVARRQNLQARLIRQRVLFMVLARRRFQL